MQNRIHAAPRFNDALKTPVKLSMIMLFTQSLEYSLSSFLVLQLFTRATLC